MVSHQKQKMFKFRTKKSPGEKPLMGASGPMNRCRKCSVCGDRGQCEVQLDWAWQPLAAKMSADSTDMVYWTPPLYNSNITEAAHAVDSTQCEASTPQQRSVRKKKFSSSRRKNRHMVDETITGDDTIKEDESMTEAMGSTTQSVDTTPEQGSIRNMKFSSLRRRATFIDDSSITEDMEDTTHSEVTPSQQRPVRKKKLSSSRRRSRLWASNLITEEIAEDNVSKDNEDDFISYCSDDRENSSIIDSESQPKYYNVDNQDIKDFEINEEAIEKPFDNYCTENPLTNESSSESDKEISNLDQETLTHNYLIQKTPVAVKHNSNKPKKLKSSPTLLKLIEKFSHLHVLPGLMQKNNKDKEITNETNNFSNKKNKRPSIKVYQRHTHRSSMRSNSSIKYKKPTSNQEEINMIAKPLLSSKLSMETIQSIQAQYQITQSGFFDQLDTDNENTITNTDNLRNAQLQTMLSILSQLYEKKLTSQQTEMQHLRTNIQTQEKLMLQLVHVTMNLKGELDKVKNNQKLGNEYEAVTEKINETEQLGSPQSFNGNYNTIIDICENTQISPKNNDHVLTIKCGEFNC